MSEGPSQSTDAAASSSSIPANPGPVSAPASPRLDAVIDSIDEVPDHTNSTYALDASAGTSADVPGPSTTFIPRQPSPPLPNVRSRQFPPDTRDAADEDDENDEVVATLPVYLAPGLSPHLHLFQYPLHHRSLRAPTYAVDRGKHITTRVKEKVGRVEVEIPIDGGPTVWRDDRARDLGFTVDVNALNGHGDDDVMGGRGTDKDKKKDKKKKDVKWGDKVRLRSDVLPHVTGYYSGVIQDGALHLQPIQKVMQFRTSLQYLDDLDSKARERAARKSGGDGEDTERRRPPPAPPGRPAMRKVEEEENDGSGSIKDFRQKMWSLSANEEADTWVPYEWREGEDPVILDSVEKLYLPEEKRQRLKTNMRPLDYLTKLRK